MIVSHWGQYSIIYTARRQHGSWQGVARIKPHAGAPEPFSATGSYTSQMSFRSESAAELGAQKEVAAAMKRLKIEGLAFDSLLAESKMRTADTSSDFSDDEAFF